MVKRSLSRTSALLLGAALFLASPAPSRGEDLSPAPLPAEAATSLFSVDMGGKDAELLVHGSWEASLMGQMGLVRDSSGGLALSSEVPILFTQSPDLYLSFILLKKYFVEARVTSDASEVRYSAGYKGGENELLKEIRVGNDGISFPTLPFLSLGAGSYRSFGASAKIGSEPFEGRAMLRYDQADRVEKKFVGSSEVSETVVAASDFIRGRYLVTPGGSAANLEVYVQSTSGTIAGGDGNKYRLLASSEYSYSAATGFIALSVAATSRIIACYTGSDSLGKNIVSLTSLSKKCALLYDPDAYPAAATRDTEVLCRYAMTGGEGVKAFVRDLSTGLKDSNYEVRVDSSGYAEVTKGGVIDPTNATYRRPFDGDMSYLYTTNFSTDSGDKTYSPNLSKAIVVRRYLPVSQISIDTDVIEGSVEVERNGVTDYAFTVDAKGGVLTLATEPGLDEEIVVTYLRESAQRSAGSVAAGLGGIFDLGDKRSAWAALGLRWSVPGASYASAGVSNPGTVTLTAGEKDSSGDFQQNAAIAGTWKTDEAAGRYRIEGMEGQGSYATSFRPLDSATNFAISQPIEAALAKVFPALESSLHSDGTSQRALRILGLSTIPATADIRLVEYLGAPPVSEFKTFAFFARESATGGAATLKVSLDTGSLSSTVLSIEVPSAALSTSWQRFVFKYGSGEGVLYRQNGEGANLETVGGAVHYDSSVSEASRLLITVSGAKADETVWVDEVCLEDATGQASLLFSGGASYRNADFSLGTSRLTLLKGIDASANSSMGLSDNSYASGGLSAATLLGPFKVSANMRGSASSGAASLRGGHSFSLPASSFPLSFADSFDMNPQAGSFGREDSLAISGGKILSLGLDSKTTWYPGTDEGLLSQAWSGNLSLAGGLLALVLTALNSAEPASLAAPGSGYFDSWIGGFAYLLPAAEAYSDRREITASLTGALSPGKNILSLKASIVGEPQDATPLRDESLTARLSLPLSIGKGFLLSPYYQRYWVERRLAEGAAGTGLIDVAAMSLSDLSSSSPLLSSVPFAEFSDASAYDAFSSYTAGAADLSTATYAPSLGLLVSRSYGSSWYDLVLPSALSAAYKRSLARSSDDSLTDAQGLEIKASFSAINLFGSMGSYPFLPSVESDEYSSTIQGTFSQVSGESGLRSDLILQNSATLYGNGNRDSFTLDQRFSLAALPSSSTWSESLSLGLSRLRARTWLLDLYRLALRGVALPSSVPRGEGDLEPVPNSSSPVPARKATIVSSFLVELAGATPVSRTVFSVSAALDSTESDAKAQALGFDIAENVEWKITVPERLTVSVKPSLVQKRDADSGDLTIGGALTLAATVSF